MKLNKHVISFIDMKLSRVDKKLDDEVEFSNIASTDGIREFCAYVSYRVDTAALSDLQKEYKKFFRSCLKDFGVTTPTDLTDRERSKFFKYIKDNWIMGVGPVEKENV